MHACRGTLSQIDSQALLTYDNLTKSGAYNDPDMLTICNGKFTNLNTNALAGKIRTSNIREMWNHLPLLSGDFDRKRGSQ
jgi:hypothetical protein